MGSTAFGRCSGFIAVAAVCVATTGCFQMTTIVKVNGDGSGTVDHTLLVTKAALAQLRQFGAMAGGGRGQRFDLISEDQARAMAESLGPGVTYVSSEPIDSPLAEGRHATFAFADITQLRISQQPKTDGLPIPAAVAASSDITCTFTRDAAGNSILQIHLPETTIPDAIANATSGNPALVSQLAMVRSMLNGARLTVVVEPAGQIVRASTPYVDGGRVTLLDVNLDRILANDAFVARLQGSKDAAEVKAALKDVDGLKITLDREVTIEFTPAR